jgi:hypothetical protein
MTNKTRRPRKPQEHTARLLQILQKNLETASDAALRAVGARDRGAPAKAGDVMKYVPIVRDRRRIAPFTIDGRTLRAWMRGADLRAPKWKPAAVYFSDKFNGKAIAKFKVSQASRERAKARAAAATRPPRDTRWLDADYRRVSALIREIGRNWKAPATAE